MGRTGRLAREVRGGFRAVIGSGTDFTHQPPGAHVDPRGLAGYYCDFRHKALAAAAHADGFPRSSSRGGRAEWAIPVAQCALGYWELHLEGHPAGAGFLPLADWLVSEARPAPGGVAWTMPFAQDKYGIVPGWPSAMAQGEAISVLLRAHALTGSERYLDTARAALGPMTLGVEAGGVSNVLDGCLVLEEYPTRTPTAVLNGWIFALFGIHELAVVTGDDRAQRLLDASRAGLLELLPRYDVGWWSLYSLRKHHGRADLAKPFYQRLHPVLLDAMNAIRPDERFGRYARRFEDQLTPPAVVRSSLDKAIFRLRRAAG